MSTYTVVETDGEGGWKVAVIEGKTCARLARTKAANRYIMPAWFDAGLQPDDTAAPPPRLAGRLILLDVVQEAQTGIGQSLAGWPAQPVVDVQGRTATWARAAVTLTGVALDAAWAAAGAQAKTRIEAAAEAERGKYLTAGTGKAMTYNAKHEEARRYAADNDPQPASYPFAAAEAAVRNISLAAVIALWGANITAWAGVLGPAIEAAEQGGKLAVDAAVAAKDASALAAAEAVSWPAPA